MLHAAFQFRRELLNCSPVNTKLRFLEVLCKILHLCLWVLSRRRRYHRYMAPPHTSLDESGKTLMEDAEIPIIKSQAQEQQQRTCARPLNHAWERCFISSHAEEKVQIVVLCKNQRFRDIDSPLKMEDHRVRRTR